MERYVVMINYGKYDGWKIEMECETLEQARQAYVQFKLRQPHDEMRIFKNMGGS